ncbi:MAG: HAD family hydrolase [Nocardioidaceae bacterium]
MFATAVARCSVIETLFFDGDQTLWDFDGLMRRTLRATLAELRGLRPGSATDGLDVESMIADRQAVGAEPHRREATMEQLRLAAFRRTLARLGLHDDELAEHLQAFYLERRFGEVDLYPDTLSSLTHLRTTYTLGLLSNGNSYPDRSGLAGLFSSVVFAQDHKVAKPERRLFDIAAEEIGSAPDNIAMVGDSLVNDVTAAQEAGWQGIWLNRDAKPCPDRHTPDVQILTLSELPAALADLDATATRRAASSTG